jgi:hypothetical protein
MAHTVRVLLLTTALVAAACDRASVHSVVFYNFTQLDASADLEHYQQFAEIDGGVVDLGCLVVQRRQLSCYDNAGSGEPNLRLAVVECQCPCAAVEPDPCDPARPMVRSGAIRGLVNQSEGALVLGGVELRSDVELAAATGLFITREPNDGDSLAPSDDVVLGGALVPDGAVIRGLLTSPSSDVRQAIVTIVPVRDEVSL